MFAQQVDAEFFASFGKAPQGVEGDDVGKYSSTFVVVDQVKELLCYFGSGSRVVVVEGAIFGGASEIVDARMLVVKSVGEDEATDTGTSEHAFHKGFELDVAMVKRRWDGTF